MLFKYNNNSYYKYGNSGSNNSDSDNEAPSVFQQP